jgi:hypothetical protein
MPETISRDTASAAGDVHPTGRLYQTNAHRAVTIDAPPEACQRPRPDAAAITVARLVGASSGGSG